MEGGQLYISERRPKRVVRTLYRDSIVIDGDQHTSVKKREERGGQEEGGRAYALASGASPTPGEIHESQLFMMFSH